MPISPGWGPGIPNFWDILHARTLYEKQQPHFSSD